MIFYQKSYFIIGLFEISLSVSKLLLFAGILQFSRRTKTTLPVRGGWLGSRGSTGGVTCIFKGGYIGPRVLGNGTN